jgi:hypothetical protein
MSEDPDRDVTVPELATWLACTAKSVQELASRGVLERSGHGRYKLQENVRRYCT